MPLLECVPNFSEGRDPAVIDAIAQAIRTVPGVKLLHVDPSPGANRTVMTFAGEPEAVVEAAFSSIRMAAARIDMQAQGGVHPRIGATDVCPLVPLDGMPMEEAVRWAAALGRRVGDALGIPVYLYEHSAAAAHRRALPDIRKGQYEGFAEKMRQPGWAPDFGPAAFNPAAGATVLGARDVLVAFNLSITGGDAGTAGRIADRLRERGAWSVDENGVRTRIPGLLRRVRAIGWHQPDYGQSQVSMNLLDYRITSPLQAYEACKALAEAEGASVAGAEVIGCIPEACLAEAGAWALAKRGLAADLPQALLVHEGMAYLGLSRLRPFDPHQQVLEWALEREGMLPRVA